MAPSSTALTTKVESGSPYQLDQGQVLKASKSLLKHMSNSSIKKEGPKDLLEENDSNTETTPIWLNITTKQHITDKNRLKPYKVPVPHPLNTSENTSICLIVADPQRTYKDIVSSPAFPPALAKRITKVVGVDKLKKKYKTYEAQRKLFSEHDIFVADDRIITRLPALLGKSFYKSTTKRPIPVIISAEAPKSDGKRIARAKGEGVAKAGEPKKIAAEIEKAITCGVFTLSSSTNSSIRIGYASWEAAQVAENLETVVNTVVEKYIPKKWRGVKSIHVKGPETAALPVWLADELWVSDADVLDEQTVKAIEETKLAKVAEKKSGKKRKSRALEEGSLSSEIEAKKQKVESNDDNLDKEIALRKETLKKQKEEAAQEVDEVPVVVKKSKKVKKTVTVA